jgi:hypothetical protein
MSKYGLTDKQYADMTRQAVTLRQADADYWIRAQLGIEEEAPAPKKTAKKKTTKKKSSKK